MIDRKPIFEAIRTVRNGQTFTLAEVKVIDAGIDKALGIAPAVLAGQPKKLEDPKKFYDHLRATHVLGPSLTAGEVQGCEALLAAMGHGLWGIGWTAYGLATAYHETAGTMQPLREYGRGKGKSYGKPGKHGQPQYGRGYVQLTWDKNYERADSSLGLNGRLLANFDLALDPAIAASILVRGMQEGWFDNIKLGDFLAIDTTGSRETFRKCRAIVNGHDKDTLIAGYAVEFQTALTEGAWC